jgi:hypothetical protein
MERIMEEEEMEVLVDEVFGDVIWTRGVVVELLGEKLVRPVGEKVGSRSVEVIDQSEVVVATSEDDVIQPGDLRLVQTEKSAYPQHNLVEVAYVAKEKRPQLIKRKPLPKVIHVGGKRYRASVVFGQGVDSIWKMW